MKKNEIKIGTTYLAKVTGKVVPVKITRENRLGGWDAVNTATGKTIRIKSAARLRKEATVGQITNAKMAKSKTEKDADARIKAGDATLAALNPVFVGGKASRPRKRVSKATKPTPTKQAKATKAAKPKRVSLLDAAATVLTSAKAPMTAKAIVDEVTAKGLWTNGKGKTPHATLYTPMTREIAKKEKDARFKKVKRGLFTAA